MAIRMMYCSVAPHAFFKCRVSRICDVDGDQRRWLGPQEADVASWKDLGHCNASETLRKSFESTICSMHVRHVLRCCGARAFLLKRRQEWTAIDPETGCFSSSLCVSRSLSRAVTLSPTMLM